MAQFEDALRGYAFDILKRDGFRCRYCGWDGSQWPNWLYLSVDHLLPPGHPQRENLDYKVAACRFCNEAYNRTVYNVEGKTPEQLVEQKKPRILEKRAEYKSFFDQKVKNS